MWYTLSEDTLSRFGTRKLAFSAIFVALGIVRYLFLVYGKGDVGRPEKVLLSDKLMWMIILGYGASVTLALYLK